MIRPLCLAFAFTAALSATAPVASAQEVTPTHTFETPLILPPFTGQIIFATLIAPPAGETIWKTELHVQWTSGINQSAALFGMHLSTSALESGPSGEWVITGAGLGWGNPPGTYSAVTSTDLFNDTLIPGLIGFPPTFNLSMDAAGGGGLWGLMGAESKLVFFLGPHLTSDVSAISVSAGGAQNLSLNAGPTVGPGVLYLLAGSATGSAPGLDLDGVHIPLVFDAYTNFTLANPNSPLLPGSLGFLDGEGKASASFQLPSGSDAALAGVQLWHSFAMVDLVGGVLISASNAESVTLTP